MAVDPREAVALGRAGTGRAVYWDADYDPLREAQKVEADKAAGVAAQRKQQAARDKALQQRLTKITFDLDSPFEPDYDKIIDARGKWIENFGNLMASYKAGEGGDPTDPSSAEWKAWNKGWNALKLRATQSKKQGEMFQKAMAAFSADPDSYEPEFLAEVDKWVNTPMERRGTPPELRDFFDEVKYDKLAWDTFLDESATAWTQITDEGTIKEFERTGISPTQAIEGGRRAYLEHPRKKEIVDERYAAMSDDEKNRVRQLTALENSRRAQKNQPQVTPQQYLAGEEFASRAYSKLKAREKDRSAFGAGQRDRDEFALNFIKVLSGLETGTADYEPAEVLEPGLLQVMFGGKAAQKSNQYEVSNVLDGYVVSEKKGRDKSKESIISVVRDKNTDKIGIYTTLDQEEGKTVEDVEFMDPDMVYSKIGYTVANMGGNRTPSAKELDRALRLAGATLSGAGRVKLGDVFGTGGRQANQPGIRLNVGGTTAPSDNRIKIEY